MIANFIFSVYVMGQLTDVKVLSFNYSCMPEKFLVRLPLDDDPFQGELIISSLLESLSKVILKNLIEFTVCKICALA